jgi:hypothetical protein
MKLAFCFLTYDDLDHREIWAPFFAGAPSDQYTIVVHSKTATSSWLPGAIMAPTVPTEWGGFGLMEAQQSLFRTAICDPDVSKIILVSGDSIPLYRFDALYRKLAADDKGYIRKVEKPQSDRKKPDRAAWPSDRPFNWSLSSQWVIFNRHHVAMLDEHFSMLTRVFSPMRIPDEHMYSIFFEGFGELASFHLTSPIHVQWDRPNPMHKLVLGPILKREKRHLGNRPCSENHRNRPHTFHKEEITRAAVAEFYKSGGLFLRKVCRLAEFNIDFSREELLRASA